jgi:hypothetical protein
MNKQQRRAVVRQAAYFAYAAVKESSRAMLVGARHGKNLRGAFHAVMREYRRVSV